MKKKKRFETGWYWVKVYGGTLWKVAYYQSSSKIWHIAFIGDVWHDDRFRETFLISENRINNPDEK